MNALLNARTLEITIPLLAAAVAWFFNERRKRAWDEYLRKEANYRLLLGASRGFYANTQDTQGKATFLEQVDLCWLYCPDDVIRRAYAFLETVKTGVASTEAERGEAFGAFVVAIRADLLKRPIARNTSLTPADYRIFSAN